MIPILQNQWALAGATVVLPARADEVTRTAADELARYLYLLTGQVSPVTEQFPSAGAAIVLDRAGVLGVTAAARDVGAQGYRLAATTRGGLRALVIAAAEPAGLLYGVYGLLEELGMGFYAGGDTFPELPAEARISAAFDRTDRPAFAIRGNMLHYNFLCGCTTWGLNDYKFYFDQLARMRCNLLLMHWYDGEPAAGYEVNGEYLAGAATPSSLSKPWGATAALHTSEFSFGTGDCFDEEIFSSPAGEDLVDTLSELKRTEIMFSEATRYARGVAVKVAAGFEAPRHDPTDPLVRGRFQARVRQFLSRNPHLTHFALWQHESGGCVGSTPPTPGTPAAELLESQRTFFTHLGNEQRVWEAIRFGSFARIAHEVLAQEQPGMPLVLIGWGGDRWMQFADMCLGYDKLFPANVIFTCHDNIDASMGPTVSSPWGQLPAARERWAMPWVEGDIAACAVRQPHVEDLGVLVPDALRKGCQGLLTLQWRTRDVEEETGFMARYAWNTTLTPAVFYRELARHAFGPDQEEAMGQRLAVLQALGEHWTGIRSTQECGAMNWTGWIPHFPFELDAATADYLIPKVQETIRALAELPVEADAEAAFHLVQSKKVAEERLDYTRPGVAELQQALARLQPLRGEKDLPRLRLALREIYEAVYAVRPRLVAFGMTGNAYCALDGFLIALNHMWRNAGAAEHLATLRRLHGEMTELRAAYLSQGRAARLERLDYLLATIDSGYYFDRAAMLLADGELVEQALASADAGRAAAAYAALVDAGMAQAVSAFSRKLTTRCDFGTLVTINVKPLPRYWEAVGRLEALLPAAPPRTLAARGKPDAVWLSWEPVRAAAQHLYRRPGSGGAWTRVNAEPLAGTCRMYIDRPAPGNYDYAVTALDDAGGESPRSHATASARGPVSEGPRIVACKPFSRLAAGAEFLLRVTALSEREITQVVLRYRTAGDAGWRQIPLRRRFRHSYQGAIPAADIAAGTLTFYVEAADNDGNTTRWPASAPALAWSATVIIPSGRV